MQCNPPYPVLLNCIKHHLGYIRATACRVTTPAQVNTLVAYTRHIGSSLADLYCGALSPNAIGNYVHQYLTDKHLLQPQHLHRYLHKHNGYTLLSLPDSSEWVLRYNPQQNYFAHIHPAKRSNLNYRFKAHTLKTGIVAFALAHSETARINSGHIARARRLLGLSPLKKSSSHPSIERFIKLMEIG